MQERGWTLYELEKRTGISQSTARRWVRGEAAPSLGVLLRLADLFELCSFEEVLGGQLGLTRCREAIVAAETASV